MSKIYFNITDNKDFITQNTSLNDAQKKEAQVARLLINQCRLPVLADGVQGKSVMMSNAFFTSKTMTEPAVMLSIANAGASAGYSREDVLETYTSASAMALSNAIQKQTMANYSSMPEDQKKTIMERIQASLKQFGVAAREANVNLGVIIATEQQVKRDLDAMKSLNDEESREQ